MLSETFQNLQNKVYTDSRDFPVLLTEEHHITGAITEENRKIKLGEKIHSLDSVLVYKLFKSSSSLDIRLVDFANLGIFYSQIDLTVNYVSYDATNDVYHFQISLYRSDTLETWNKSYDVTGSLGISSTLIFDTIWGSFSVLVGNFISNGKVVISMIGYESSVLVLDAFNPFIGNGAVNHLFFNIPSNAVYINELPMPQNSGEIYVLTRYMGLGSVITAESLNDIVNVVKYYNLMPKFEVIKNNNQDIQLIIRGEYYYLGNYVEKIEDSTYHIEDEVLLGQWNAIVGFLDIPNHIFNIRRVAVSDTYGNVLADLTNWTNENPDFEIPIFITIFDVNKNLFEYAYINRGVFSSSGGSSINMYNVTFSGVTNMSFSLLSDRKPVINVQDQDGIEVIPDRKQCTANFVEIGFNEPQTGTVSAVN